MNRDNIADCFNKLTKKEESNKSTENKGIFTKNSIKIFHFLKFNSKSLDDINLEEFIKFFTTAIKNKYNDVINNIKNMNLTPDLTKKPEEVDNTKLPRYYLSNNVRGYEDSYLWKSFTDNFTYSLNENIFDFMSFLSVNEEMYNNVLNNFNKKEFMKLTKKNNRYILLKVLLKMLKY